MAQKAYLAAGVGGTHLEAAIVDQNARIVWRKALPSPCGGALMEEARRVSDRIAFTLERWEEFVPHRNRLLDATATLLGEARTEAGAIGLVVDRAGVGVAGAVNPLTGDIEGKTGALNHPAWGDFNPARQLEERTGLSIVCLNDAKAMALGALATLDTAAVVFADEAVVFADEAVVFADEDRHGAPREIPLPEAQQAITDFVEIDPGTGLGGAYIVGGKVWYGPDPARPDPDVGEIWHIEPDPNQRGVRFEEMVSGRAIGDRVIDSLSALGDPRVAELIEEKGTKIQDLLAAEYEPVSEVIRTVLAEAGRNLARGIRHIAGPEQKRLGAPAIKTFVIGGGLVSGRKKESTFVRATLDRAIRSFFATDDSGSPPTVLFTTLGGWALLIGAASAAKSIG